MLEHLVEHLGRLELVGQVARDVAGDRLVDPSHPIVRDDLLALVLAVLAGPERIEVVEQPAGLALLHVEPGQPHEPAAVVPGVDDLGLDLDRRAVDVGGHRQLVDVEAELVEPADPLVDAPPVSGLEALDAGQLLPQLLVAQHDVLGDLDGVGLVLEHATRGEVHELTGDVDAGDVEVVGALAVAQRG